MEDGVSGDFADIGGGELPDLRGHAVLLHQGLLGQMDLHQAHGFSSGT